MEVSRRINSLTPKLLNDLKKLNPLREILEGFSVH